MQRLLEILHKEVTPAQGCTEPIAVAYAVAAAAQQTQGEIQRIELCLSGNILKNAMGVGIPGTGQTGVDIAALLGSPIHLQLWVKVKKDWRDSDFLLKNFGYDAKRI